MVNEIYFRESKINEKRLRAQMKLELNRLLMSFSFFLFLILSLFARIFVVIVKMATIQRD